MFGDPIGAPIVSYASSLTSIESVGVAVNRIVPSWFSLTRNRSASLSGVSERVVLSPTDKIASS
ncbi:hypothetical protein D3C83_156030 [compost metagenome]